MSDFRLFLSENGHKNGNESLADGFFRGQTQMGVHRASGRWALAGLTNQGAGYGDGESMTGG